MRYNFTDKEIKEILSNLTVVIDNREQANLHITDWLDKKKIPYREETLKYGDYSCMIPAGTFEGQKRDIYFTDSIAIERKFCIDELAMNLKDNKTNINEVNKEIIELLGEKYLKKVLKTDYNRLKSELQGLNRYGIKFFIFLEDKEFDKNIREGNYRNQYKPASLYARLKALESEFNTVLRPVDKSLMGSEIYNTLRYCVRDILKNKGFMEE